MEKYLLVGFVVTVVPQVTVLSPETPSVISTVGSIIQRIIQIQDSEELAWGLRAVSSGGGLNPSLFDSECFLLCYSKPLSCRVVNIVISNTGVECHLLSLRRLLLFLFIPLILNSVQCLLLFSISICFLKKHIHLVILSVISVKSFELFSHSPNIFPLILYPRSYIAFGT